jgi:ABC-type uncharacterized transport system substrate-binding protein
MKRAAVLSVGVAVVMLTVAVMVEAQQPTKIPRIGYLSSTDQAQDFGRAEATRLALRTLGYTERQNITIEYRYAENKLNRLPELATELASLNVDLIIIAGGDTVIRPAMKATKKFPSS